MKLETLAARLGLDMSIEASSRENYHRNRIEQDGSALRFSYGAVLRLPPASSVSDVSVSASNLAQVCAWAKTNKWTVRGLGSAWSFSDAMAPGRVLAADRESILVDTSNFKLLQPSHKKRNLYYVTGGANIRNTNLALERRDLSVKTSGSSDGQTIAGALGTGVHGSAYRFGALHNAVKAYHIAIPGSHILVARNDAECPQAVRDEFQQMFDIADVRVDEALFDALSVSFGSFGIVVGVVMEVDPLYALRVIRRPFPAAKLPALIEKMVADGELGDVDAKLRRVRTTDILHHCQILFNLYDSQNYKVVVMHQRADHNPAAVFKWPGVFDAHGVAVINAFWGVLDHADALFQPLITGRFNGLPDVDAWGYRSDIFGTPEQPLPVHSFAVGVPIANTVEALELAHAAVAIEKFPGAGELRFVKGSPAYLAINRFAPITAVVGFDGVDSKDSWEFTRLFLRKIREARIPHAFHWGKMTHLDKNDAAGNYEILKTMYGGSLERWRTARATLLGKAGSAVFNNAFVKRLGI